jgi:hypothetical protein
MVELPLHLFPRQGLVAEFAHGRAEHLRDKQTAHNAPIPLARADIPFRSRPLAPGVDGGEDVLDARKVGSRAEPGRADETQSCLPRQLHICGRGNPKESPYAIVRHPTGAVGDLLPR